jgi:four helix bundle protein
MIQGLEDFKTYHKAMEVGEKVWEVVMKWNYFEKDTVGKQLVRAVDSIAANLSEGLGRYHYKEIKNFSYYSRGSLFETKTWLVKANTRKLIDENTFKELMKELDVIGKMINTYIKSIGEKSNEVNEPEEEYLPLSPTPNPQPLSSNPQVPMPNPQVPMPNAF